MRVEFADAAREQIRAAAAWWRENRPAAPQLFEEELALAIAMLDTGPLLTRVFDEIEGKVVRKARLPRSRCALYFTVSNDLSSRTSRPVDRDASLEAWKADPGMARRATGDHA